MSNPPRPAKIYRSACRKFAACVAAVTLVALCLFAPSQPTARAQNAGTQSTLVVSQIYTRGGEPGAAFQNDYIELFNRGNASVDMNGWGLHIALKSSPIPTAATIKFVSSRGIPVEPGRYLLIKLAGGANGQPLPSPDFDISGLPGPFPLDLNSASGEVGLLTPDGSFQNCPTAPTAGVADYVGYGAAICFEGFDGPAPAPTLSSATLRDGGGCSDNNSSAIDFHLGAATPRNSSTPAVPCNFPPPPSFFNFAAPQFDTTEFQDHTTINVTRIGDTSV